MLYPSLFNIQKFQKFYAPTEFLSLDEGMIPAKNHLGIKQYIKNKPVKWGLKKFLLCDSTNGYVTNFEVYSGKEPHITPHLCATGNGVHRLFTSTQLLDLGHTLVMDRFTLLQLPFLISITLCVGPIALVPQ